VDYRSAGRGPKIFTGETFECAFCQGSGVLPHSKGIKCPVCGGDGTVSVKAPAVVCAYCHGRGEVSPRTNITCIVCRGKGVVTIPEPRDLCPHCRGTGAEFTNKLPCLSCKGKGLLTAKR
jgi:DnaJ-class molecular chaperone